VLHAAVGACQYHGDLVLTIQWCCRTIGFGRALKCILRRTLPITLYSTAFFDATAAAVVVVVVAADSSGS
jgi:hypothetical protein